MHNFFITQYFNWTVKRISYLDRLVCRSLWKLGIRTDFRSAHFVDLLVSRLTGRSAFPVTSGTMTNIEKRMNIYHLVSQVLAFDVEGDLVELGCNSGEASVLISRILQDYGSKKRLAVYDSFEGLPSSSGIDGSAYHQGDLATTEDILVDNFNRYNLRIPEIHKGWFEETLPYTLPDKICFAHLDGDFYHSILVSLEHVYPRMSEGAICVIDDYCDPELNPMGWNQLPGVKKACDEYMMDKPEKIVSMYSGAFSHAFFRRGRASERLTSFGLAAGSLLVASVLASPL